MPKRSLYQCYHAKVRGRKIFCAKGHRLNKISKDGSILAAALARGAPLEFEICQHCTDYEEMGPPIPRSERGWAKLPPGAVWTRL